MTFSAKELREALKGLDQLRYATGDHQQALRVIVSATVPPEPIEQLFDR